MIPLFTAALATGAAAAAIFPPTNPLAQVVLPIPPFSITNFAAGAVILSNRNYVNFNVTLSPDTPPFCCQALGTTAGETLGSIPQTWCTSSSSPPSSGGDESRNVWFTWTMGQAAQSSSTDGANLRIVRQLDSQTYDEAVYHIPASDTPVVGQGMLAHQVYRGPANFSVDALRYCNKFAPRRG